MVAVVANYKGEKWGSKNRAVKSITGAIGGPQPKEQAEEREMTRFVFCNLSCQSYGLATGVDS
jgi:hypothetical protein